MSFDIYILELALSAPRAEQRAISMNTIAKITQKSDSDLTVTAFADFSTTFLQLRKRLVFFGR